MAAFARPLLLVTVLCVAAANARAQTATPDAQASSASIAGRITVSGRPAPGVEVALLMSGPNAPRLAVAKVVTDGEGRFQFGAVAAGRYTIAPLAPALVLPGPPRPGMRGKTVTLAEGEAIEGIELALTRGGVITGRVTDAAGQPMIAERVFLTMRDEGGFQSAIFTPAIAQLETDDRGIYRAYGLPAGRYLVSVGTHTGTAQSNSRRLIYPTTYHPGVVEMAKATLVEVSEGSEVTNVDIALGRPASTYDVTGRLVEAETGKPVPYSRYGYGELRGDGKLGGGVYGLAADAQGEFRITGVTPGRYAVYVTPDSAHPFYSDLVSFEVTSDDVSGVEVELRRGASLSGTVVMDGASDPSGASQLPQLRPRITSERPMLSAGQVRLNADSSFQATGLYPGKVWLALSPNGPKGFSLWRVERDGVAQDRGFEVKPGEHVTGVRVVVSYGTGLIRGQVQIVGGTLPEGAEVVVLARRVGDPNPDPGWSGLQVDARGQFIMEGLSAGDYELTVETRPRFTPGAWAPRLPRRTQRVRVRNGAETQVTLVVNMAPGPSGLLIAAKHFPQHKRAIGVQFKTDDFRKLKRHPCGHLAEVARIGLRRTSYLGKKEDQMLCKANCC